MKTWNSFGSEHSANLVIIGEFKSPRDAAKAKQLLDDVMAVASDEFGKHSDENLSEPMLSMSAKHNLNYSGSDADGMGYHHNVEINGNRVVITTEEMEIQGILKVLLRGEAKIEIYSAHSHQSPYGRQTFKRED